MYHAKIRPIKGTGLLHRRRMGPHERAELAVDAILGVRPFVPSVGQAAQLFVVPLPILREHIKARSQPANGNGGGTLVEHLLHATPSELIEAGQEFGIGRLWDLMIVPNIGNSEAAE